MQGFCRYKVHKGTIGYKLVSQYLFKNKRLYLDLFFAGVINMSVDQGSFASPSGASKESDRVYRDSSRLDARNQGPSDHAFTLQTRLSATLYKKLQRKSQVEGVSFDELIRELLSEGVVLRAWEVLERKAAMRKGSMPVQNHQNRNHRYNGQRGGAPRSKTSYYSGGNSFTSLNSQQNKSNHKRQDFNQIMDDNANFLEYVRNQENEQ